METLAEAKKYLQDNFKKGISCPCCHQFVKLYPRKITSSMSKALIGMFRETKAGGGEKEWADSRNYIAIPDVVKFVHWGILEAQEGQRDDGSKRVGWYKLTEKGIEFVNGRISVPMRVKLYNQKFYGFEGGEVYIYDTFKNRFDYNELMGI